MIDHYEAHELLTSVHKSQQNLQTVPESSMIVSTIRPKAGVTFCSAKSLSAALESANNILKISFALANPKRTEAEVLPVKPDERFLPFHTIWRVYPRFQQQNNHEVLPIKNHNQLS